VEKEPFLGGKTELLRIGVDLVDPSQALDHKAALGGEILHHLHEISPPVSLIPSSG